MGQDGSPGRAEDGSFDQVTAQVHRLTDGAGADFVFESTGRPDCIDAAIRLCRPFGCFVWQGNYGDGHRCGNVSGARQY